MTPNDFQRVAFNPSLRPEMMAQLRGDPILRNAAIKRVADLEEQQKIGMVLDRCHVTKTEYQILKRMLTLLSMENDAPASVEKL